MNWHGHIVINCNCGCGTRVYLGLDQERDPDGPDPGVLAVTHPGGGGSIALTDADLRALYDKLGEYIQAQEG